MPIYFDLFMFFTIIFNFPDEFYSRFQLLRISSGILQDLSLSSCSWNAINDLLIKWDLKIINIIIN